MREKRRGPPGGGGGVWCLRDQWEVKGYLMQHTISKGLRINKNRRKKVKKKVGLGDPGRVSLFLKEAIEVFVCFLTLDA